MRVRCDGFLGELAAQVVFAIAAGLASALAERAAEAWLDRRPRHE